MSKKKAPNYCVLPVTGGHCGPNGKRASFFPVIFQSFESLPVVTDRQTDRLKGCRLSNLPVERIKPKNSSKIMQFLAGGLGLFVIS